VCLEQKAKLKAQSYQPYADKKNSCFLAINSFSNKEAQMLYSLIRHVITKEEGIVINSNRAAALQYRVQIVTQRVEQEKREATKSARSRRSIKVTSNAKAAVGKRSKTPAIPSE
jgi:hypothetical protein